MAPHPNRGRLTVDTDGDWRRYTTTIPSGATAIGVVCQGEVERGIGTLVRLKNGNYVQFNCGAIRNLASYKVAAVLEIANLNSETMQP